MYHSVAPEIRHWVFKHLSIDPAVFEDHLATLARAGYSSILLADLVAYVSGARSLPPRSVALTFDDGYLDNWVFAFPLLKKYGFKATIFVSTDFVDSRDMVRPTLDDVWSGRGGRDHLTVGGFLSGREIRAMVASGLVDVEAHCRTHTWYFTGERIVDFHHPGDAYPWLAWNARPDRKPLYIEEDQASYVPFGSPVYVHDKSLVARRYLPDPALEPRLAAFVAANGGSAFFGKPGWADELAGLVGKTSAGAGRYETDDERAARLRDEIVASKSELERLTGKPVEFLCWPGGAYDDGCVQLARDAGYRAWTMGSRARTGKRNLPGEDPAWIRRVAAAPWWFYRGQKRCAVDGEFLRLILETYKGFAFAGFELKWYKLRKLFRSWCT
jgi:peptidoglycan/xylan/chitin deacetylase (PgdA/CDA1 family)